MEDSQQSPLTGARPSHDPDASLDGPLKPVALVGYTRKGDPDDRRRLYMDQKSDTFVEIKVADIVAPPSKIRGLQPGQVVIWVRGDARVDLIEYPLPILMGRPPWPRR